MNFSRPDCHQERLDADDVHYTREVVGKYVQRHFGRDIGQPVCTEKSNPRVVMVKSAQDGVRTDETGSLNRPRIRRIFV